jgi:hypothetical protein
VRESATSLATCSSEDQLVTLRLDNGFPVPELWQFANHNELWVSAFPAFRRCRQSGRST